MAASRTAAAEQRLTAAMTEQATAERELMAATSGEAGDQEAVAVASERLAKAERDAAKAATELEAAQKRQSDTAAAAAAKEDLAAGATDKAAASNGRLKRGMSGIGLAAAGIAGGVALIGAHSIKSAQTFQASMALIHTQAGAADEDIKGLGDQVIALAPKVGQGPNELAQGLYHIESAGFRGKRALDILTAAAKGATIGNADLETVTQAMIATTASGIKGVGGMSDAMGKLNAIVGSGDMRMEAFSHSMGSGILSTAKTFGLSLTDVGAAMATLTDNAVPADDAATRLRMTFSMMGAPSQAAAKAMKSIGLNATSLADDMRRPNGLLVAMEDLRSHLNRPVTGSAFTGTVAQAKGALMGMGLTAQQATARIKQVGIGGALAESQMHKFGFTSQQVNAMMGKLGPTATEQAVILARAFGGGRTSGAILTLLGQMDRFKGKYKTIGDGAKNFGKSWEETTKTAVFQGKSLHASVEAVSTSLGTALLPAVQKVLGEVIKIIGPMVQWSTKHKDLMAAILGGLGGLATFTASVVAITKVAGAVKTTYNAIKTVTAATKIWSGVQAAFNLVMDANPIMLVVIAVAALVAGIIYAYTHFKAFRDVVNAVFDWLKSAVVDVIHFVENHWRLIIAIIGGPLGWAVALVTKYWKQISGGFMAGVHAVESAVSWFNRLPGMFWGWLSSTAERVWRGISAINGYFLRLPGDIVNFLNGLPGQLLTIGNNIVVGLWNGITQAGSWLWNKLTGWAGGILHNLEHAFGIASPSKKTAEHGRYLAEGYAEGILRHTGKAVAAAKAMAGAVLAAGAVTGNPALDAAGGVLGAAAVAAGGLRPGAGGGSAVNLTIDLRGAQVMTERDMDMLVDKVGRAVATRILPSGGVRISR